MTTVIKKWGNSQGIRISKNVLEALKWCVGEEISIETEKDSIVLTKVNKRKSLSELFEGYEGTYEPTEIEWGKPEGKEIW